MNLDVEKVHDVARATTPLATASDAPAMWTRSLRPALTPRMSSITETARIGNPRRSARSTARAAATRRTAEAAPPTPRDSRPRPPEPTSRGVGPAWVFRRPGSRSRRPGRARRAVSGVEREGHAAAAQPRRTSERYCSHGHRVTAVWRDSTGSAAAARLEQRQVASAPRRAGCTRVERRPPDSPIAVRMRDRAPTCRRHRQGGRVAGRQPRSRRRRRSNVSRASPSTPSTIGRRGGHRLEHLRRQHGLEDC
jgi:hypothetical protein